MANIRADDEIVTEFLLSTCRKRRWINFDDVRAINHCAILSAQHVNCDDVEIDLIPATTGSVAEFYVEPMLSCIGDVDIMFHPSDELAIPAGTAPPTQLPDEFDSRVKVFEIVDSEFPGYVYLILSYLLTECIDDGKYNAVKCERLYMASEDHDKRHGPALVTEDAASPSYVGRLAGSACSADNVYCIRCLSWPPQAGDWPTRHRNQCWPDSATVDRVVSSGCDVVQVAHRLCRQDEWMNKYQWRLSFSRAEIVLFNSWIPVQQILYHMLRVFVKTERLTDSANNSNVAKLSNYHIKTLMLWACELKPRSWWIDDLNVVRLCVKLLHTLSIWLTDAHCPHYFVNNSNLFDHLDNECCSQRSIASRLTAETESSLAEWFIDNILCAKMCATLPW